MKALSIKWNSPQKKGAILVYLLVIMFLFTVMMMPIIGRLTTNGKLLKTAIDREEALQIAEAGVNYYQWHLAHYPADFQDGTGVAGPYVHDYADFDTQEVIGHYSLTITPPVTGSTIVTITSTGYTTNNPSVTRTITAKYGVPSLAEFSFLSNDVIWIGDTESVVGKLQSNNGVRFDGTGNAPITSAKSTYTCPSTQGSPCPTTKNGVWGSASQATQNFWQFPVPATDFSALTANLATMKASAQSAGIYLPPSSALGYSLVFKNDSTIDIYKVTSLTNNPTGWDVNGTAHNENIDYNARTLLYNKPIPANGYVYVEDKIWVEGVVKGRVMVAAAQLPYNAATAPIIYIPDNITYAAKDGTNVLGLLSQSGVIVTYHAPATLEIDAALIAQNGSAQFYYYPGKVKTSITIFGSIMTFGQWTWSWVNGGGAIVSGYTNTTDIYDGDLLYSPPPGFPLSSSGYQLLDWTSN